MLIQLICICKTLYYKIKK